MRYVDFNLKKKNKKKIIFDQLSKINEKHLSSLLGRQFLLSISLDGKHKLIWKRPVVCMKKVNNMSDGYAIMKKKVLLYQRKLQFIGQTEKKNY